MTDMRATERLLQVIATQSMMLLLSRPEDHRLLKIEEAISELRERGDTLVRAEDLEAALGLMEMVNPEEQAIYDRLENALGGKP